MLASTNKRDRSLVPSRLKKNSPLHTHIFLFDRLHVEIDDYQMEIVYIKKIYTSYVFFLKAKVEDIVSTTDNLTIKKLVVVEGIFS